MPNFEIYTDGSFKGHWGSWAYLIVKNNSVICEASGRVKKTNSNRMEFQAAIEALKTLPKGTVATVFTDCKILIENINLLAEWQSNDWIKKNKSPIPNVDLYICLHELLTSLNISWKWIRAHSGNKYNERCDELCLLAREP